MTEQMVGILTLVALLLPTAGALVARFLGRRFGARVMRLIAGLSFVAALASGVALSQAELDRSSLGSLAAVVPLPGPLVDADAFILARAAPPTVEPTEVVVVVAEAMSTDVSSATVVAPPATSTLPPTSTTAPSATPIPLPSPTAAPTTTPTAPAANTPAPAATVQPTPTSEPSPAATPTREPAPEAIAYTVKPGDTLRSIAAQFEVSVDALFRYNGLSAEEADSLRPGQKLFVPPLRGAEPQAPAAPRPTATRRPALGPRSYVVEPGDTLRGIASQFDVSAAELQRYNGLSAEEADSLRPGQRLFIPPR